MSHVSRSLTALALPCATPGLAGRHVGHGLPGWSPVTHSFPRSAIAASPHHVGLTQMLPPQERG